MNDEIGLTRAGELFEDWLARVKRGSAEPFEAFVAAYPELREPLELMWKAEQGVGELAGRHAPAGNASRSRRSSGGHLSAGDELGGFRIVRELGRGGMGIVFEAEQVSLRRSVALKILPAQLTLNPQALERFRREAAITGRLKHRGIVDIHEVGEERGIHFIVMELVEGVSLDRVIDRMRGESESLERVRKVQIADVVEIHGLDSAWKPSTPQPTKPASGEPGTKRKASSSASNKNYIESAVRLICQVADALDHAHRAGVVHRDIKPANILVRHDGSPVLTDFGLARESGLPGITVTGAFAGTPNYVSPEQAMSGRVAVDHRSDIFSLGATLYELVTLHPAFGGDNLPEILGKILSKPPLAPQKLNAALAPDLVTILEKALEKDPDRRYQTAAELAEDLRAFIEYRPIRAKRTATVVRALRWVRREPLKAVLGTVLALGLPGGSFLWVNALEARRDLRAAELPDRLDRAFLAVGTGELEEAERVFRGVLGERPDSQEAAAGLALTLTAARRVPEALQWIDEFERERPGALGRLRVEAMEAAGQREAARELARALPPATSASDKYLEAMRLIYGCPFVVGVPEERLIPQLDGRSDGRRLAADPSRDTLARYRNDARAAIDLLEDASAEANHALYHFALAWAAWVARDAEVAQRYARTIELKWSDTPTGAFYSALAREVFDPSGALAAYAAVLERTPDLWPARQRRAAILLDRGDKAAALVEMRALVAVAPDRATFQENLARVLLFDGQARAATEAARAALELERSSPEAHDLEGCALFALRDFQGARRSFDRALVLDENRASYHSHLGWTLVELGEVQAALTHLEQAVELDPTDALATFNLGLAALRLRQHERAVEVLGRALALHEANPPLGLGADRILASQAAAFSELGELEEAAEVLAKATELAPNDPALWSTLAVAARSAGQRAEAADAMERSLALDPAVSDDHLALIRFLGELGEWSRALTVAKRWTEAHPSVSKAWNERALLQVAPHNAPPVGDLADALRSAERAVELTEERDYASLDTLACALFASGRREEALERGSQAFELAEAQQAPRMLLAEIQANLERFEAALDTQAE